MPSSSLSSVQHAGVANRLPRSQSAAAVSRHIQRAHSRRAANGYTLAHGGRQVRIGPVAFWIVVGTLVVMGLWSIATGTYFAFHDDVITRLVGRQAQMQFAYEDRIAELRAQVDRIASRQLLDQEQFEKKLNTLLGRQSVLEQRSTTLANDGLITGSIRPARGSSTVEAQAEQPHKPPPISNTVIFTAPPDHDARLESRMLPQNATRLASANGAGVDAMLARISLSLDKVEHRQTAALTNLERTYDGRARRIRDVLDDLGLDAAKAARNVAVGGPFVPLKPPSSGASAFDRQLYRVNRSRAELAQYSRVLTVVPVRKPVAGEVDMSSPFGMRMDPFLGRPAIHTGIDLRGDIGEPVRVTANGKVTIASRDGGYGNLVEVDHGDGLSTRYGHLSKILVRVGQYVHTGETIGLIGSTGRSTGPHLHYETRINGEAVNPQKFLRAGIRLGKV
jgi:murein DD-endopeptidase MepM/ murein hydrolase activator NlpD